MKFPETRLRRLRKTENLRRLVQETHLSADQLIMPYFVSEILRGKEPIRSMPGQFRFSLQSLLRELDGLIRSGIRNIILFGIPKHKDEKASSAYAPKGVIQQAIRQIKKRFPNLTVISDVCLCEYMSHGHCGIIKNRQIQNDASLELLAKTAVSHAEAGADIVAPSDMMDGRIAAIRENLDRNGFEELPILSYAAKFASAYYGPFREAAHSAPSFGDRKSYQMNPANRGEALREIRSDLKEGADMIMIKPALPYLDIIRDAKLKFQIPIAAYQVSGEYSMVKAGAQAGFLDEKQMVLESLLSIKRAGANIILTYFAKDVAKWLK